jgi:hypothetical protein
MEWCTPYALVKASVQSICGDEEGAQATMAKNREQSPIQTAVRGTYQRVIEGDRAAAKKEFTQCKKTCSTVGHGLANATPGLGHVKGVYHYARGDNAKGDEAMKASSRSLVATGCAIGGFAVAGPVGAAAAYVAGASTMDGVITVADSACKHKYAPHGHLKHLENVRNCSSASEASGPLLDWAFKGGMDVLGGDLEGDGLEEISHDDAGSAPVATVGQQQPAPAAAVPLPPPQTAQCYSTPELEVLECDQAEATPVAAPVVDPYPTDFWHDISNGMASDLKEFAHLVEQLRGWTTVADPSMILAQLSQKQLAELAQEFCLPELDSKREWLHDRCR